MEKTNYAEAAAKLQGTEKKGKPVDKPKKCQYSGCPMLAATTVEGRHKCSFHNTGDFHKEVTISIVQNKTFIERYNNMVKFDVNDWTENKGYLINSKHCPMEENELPSIYLVRFFNWISEKISDDATILVNQKLKGEQQ